MTNATGKSKSRRPVDPDLVDLDREDVRDSKGRRITEAEAERLSADALAQVRGRPSLSGRAVHSPRVSVRVTDEVSHKLDELVARTGRSRSEIARAALEEYVSHQQVS